MNFAGECKGETHQLKIKSLEERHLKMTLHQVLLPGMTLMFLHLPAFKMQNLPVYFGSFFAKDKLSSLLFYHTWSLSWTPLYLHEDSVFTFSLSFSFHKAQRWVLWLGFSWTYVACPPKEVLRATSIPIRRLGYWHVTKIPSSVSLKGEFITRWFQSSTFFYFTWHAHRDMNPNHGLKLSSGYHSYVYTWLWYVSWVFKLKYF